MNLLKIDVEGFELEVLQGARGTIGAIKNVVFEVLPSESPDKVQAIQQLLHVSGFRMYDVEGVEWCPGQACIENNVWARRS